MRCPRGGEPAREVTAVGHVRRFYVCESPSCSQGRFSPDPPDPPGGAAINDLSASPPW
jgi:hypothetical protein